MNLPISEPQPRTPSHISKLVLGVDRTVTWPTVGFLLGFASQPRVGAGIGTVEFVTVSFIAGLIIAFAAWVAAKVGIRQRRASRMALPYVQGRKVAIIFNLTMVAILATKILCMRGLMPLALSLVSIAIVARGAERARTEADRWHAALRQERAERAATQQRTAGPSDERMEVPTAPKSKEKIVETQSLNRSPRLVQGLSAIIILSAWAGFIWLISYLAAERVKDCGNTLYTKAQYDMCLRHAYEARDLAYLIGAGLPVVAIIGLLIFVNIRMMAKPSR